MTNPNVNIEALVIELVSEILGAASAPGGPVSSTPLLGNPDFDSMAVASLLAGLEESLGIPFDDGLEAHVFETVGSLVDHLTTRLPH